MEAQWNFVGAAYGLTWVVLSAYALHVHRRVRRARRALGELEGGRP